MDSKTERQKRLAVERDYWRRSAILNCAADAPVLDENFRHVIDLARALQKIDH
jgi:hypothetical protein